MAETGAVRKGIGPEKAVVADFNRTNHDAAGTLANHHIQRWFIGFRAVKTDFICDGAIDEGFCDTQPQVEI